MTRLSLIRADCSSDNPKRVHRTLPLHNSLLPKSIEPEAVADFLERKIGYRLRLNEATSDGTFR